MIFRILVILLIPILIYTQVSSDSAEEYQFLLSEVQLLEQYTPLSLENVSLIDSAKNAADNNEFELASVYLEVILDGLYIVSDQNLNESTLYVLDSYQKFNFRINSGLDFNQQEFEIGYIESDSVILNEVNKPFIGFDLDYLLAGTKQHGIGLDLYIRTDNENTEGRLQLNNPYKRNKSYGYNNLQLNCDNNRVNPDLSYWEIAGQQLLNFTFEEWYIQIANNFRYKEYNQPSQSVPGFIKNTASFNTFYENNILKNTRIFYQFDINESINYKNNDYVVHSMGLNFLNWIPGRVGNEIKTEYIYNDFTYALEDSIIDNTSKTIVGMLDIRVPLLKNLYLSADYQYKYKSYLTKSEQDPDYWEQELNTSIQKDILKKLSIGMGYHLQQRKHELFNGSESIYINEQNFNDQGILAEINFHHSENILFTGMITYSRRKYPESENMTSLSFYTSKNILNLFILFQAPINDNLSVNLFFTYDNDKELDNDRNDSRSVILSAELEYKF